MSGSQVSSVRLSRSVRLSAACVSGVGPRRSIPTIAASRAQIPPICSAPLGCQPRSIRPVSGSTSLAGSLSPWVSRVRATVVSKPQAPAVAVRVSLGLIRASVDAWRAAASTLSRKAAEHMSCEPKPSACRAPPTLAIGWLWVVSDTTPTAPAGRAKERRSQMAPAARTCGRHRWTRSIRLVA